MRIAMSGCLGLILTLFCLSLAAGSTDLTKRRSEAERQQEVLRNKIDGLQKQISQREANRRRTMDGLKASENKLSQIDRRLHELNVRNQSAHEDWLALNHQISTQQKMLVSHRAGLAKQIRAQYLSKLSPWTMMLSGHNPQELGRNLAYLEYVSQARVNIVNTLRQDIDHLNHLQTLADARSKEIKKLVNKSEHHKLELIAERKNRTQLLSQLESQIATQRVEAARMERDEQRLTHVINDLQATINKHIADAKAARARREAQKARQAQALKRQNQYASSSKKRTILSENSSSSNTENNGLHPGLPAPVVGQIQGRFGTKRPEGGTWRGIVLRALTGTPVRAVAPGVVVYAQSLRGFGNLIILDHGAQYLTVYAYNQTLLKQVGQTVKLGETIATVGATGSQVESGLYFEIRHRGVPTDPGNWLAP